MYIEEGVALEVAPSFYVVYKFVIDMLQNMILFEKIC